MELVGCVVDSASVRRDRQTGLKTFFRRVSFREWSANRTLGFSGKSWTAEWQIRATAQALAGQSSLGTRWREKK